MESDPQADGPRPGQVGQRPVGEVLGRFLGGQVQVGEDDDPRDRMLENLGAPAGVRPAWKRSRKSKPSRVNIRMRRGKKRREQRNVW